MALPVLGQIPVQNRTRDLAINGAIGAISGGIGALTCHQSFWTGVRHGAEGGAIIAVGRQIAATSFDGSGLLGRQVSGAGISLIKSAATPGPIVWTFPVGPLSLDYRFGNVPAWRINLTELAAAVGLSVSPNTRFDLRKSLSAGAPVYRDRRPTFGNAGDTELVGYELVGTIRLAKNASQFRNVIYHENVHVLQDDYFDEIVALPIENTVVQRLPFGEKLRRHFDVGLLGPELETLLNRAIPYQRRPWEQEAYAITGSSTE